jgi:hypothetical protein
VSGAQRLALTGQTEKTSRRHLRRDRAKMRSGGRLWKPLCGFHAAVDGALPSTAAAASAPWSNFGKTLIKITNLGSTTTAIEPPAKSGRKFRAAGEVYGRERLSLFAVCPGFG